MDVVLIALVLQCCVVSVSGYPGGAPPNSCAGMVPGHSGATVQAGASPYTVTMNTSTYTAGDVIEVTVSGGTFRGLLVQAQSPGCFGFPLPSFSVMPGDTNVSTLTCPGQANSAITHTNRNDKTQATFYWTPGQDLGHINFRATVVQNFNIFWVNITSPELRNSVNPVPGPSCQTNGNQNNAGADLKAHTVFSILSMLAALFFVV